jgi:NAD(P)-dependent dehydrogenase (short-subunit alcohol dehydrogenase family)
VAEGLAAEAKIGGVSIEEARRASVVRIPMGRMAEPEEIANAVLFLASSKASYITGVSISMDGAANPVVV